MQRAASPAFAFQYIQSIVKSQHIIFFVISVGISLHFVCEAEVHLDPFFDGVQTGLVHTRKLQQVLLFTASLCHLLAHFA